MATEKSGPPAPVDDAYAEAHAAGPDAEAAAVGEALAEATVLPQDGAQAFNFILGAMMKGRRTQVQDQAEAMAAVRRVEEDRNLYEVARVLFMAQRNRESRGFPPTRAMDKGLTAKKPAKKRRSTKVGKVELLSWLCRLGGVSYGLYREYEKSRAVLGDEFMRLSQSLGLSRDVIREARKLPDGKRKALVERAMDSRLTDPEEVRELVRELVSSERKTREDAETTQKQRDEHADGVKHHRAEARKAKAEVRKLQAERDELRARLAAARSGADFSSLEMARALEPWRDVATALRILRDYCRARPGVAAFDDGSGDGLLSVMRLAEKYETVRRTLIEFFGALADEALRGRAGGAKAREAAERRAREIEHNLPAEATALGDEDGEEEET